MLKLKDFLQRWGFAILMMAAIFGFSSRPNNELPNFGSVDSLVKKGGHMIGYALLGLSYWRGLELKRNKVWLAWLLAILYAITDEFHQTFVPGRHPSPWDVMIFDNLGAMIGLLVYAIFKKKFAGNKQR
ncbi:MAG TPA: VanZ family protein [Anaerolineales bacterium]|nr:VanZ family protein [Anaerolineales bacterium]